MPRRSVRFRLDLAYDGRPFRGWQSQPDGSGVQDHLERALEKVAGEKIRVHGAGRTDAGVHAAGQVAHFDAKAKLQAHEWQRALNANLPAAIRVMEARHVEAGFHARFSAVEKLYSYRIFTGPVLPPLEAGLCWHHPRSFDKPTLRRLLVALEGTHDFRRFSANRGTPVLSSVRTVFSTGLRCDGRVLITDFRGEGFLYKMVRSLVGAAFAVASGTRDEAWFRSLLGDPSGERNPLIAPADGLCLEGVRYPPAAGD